MYQNDINGYYGFSEDTEVKTDHGWKLVKDININTDHILSLNPKTHEIEYVNLIDKIDQPYNGVFKPWSKGGKTELSNCQMLCKWHNEHKSNN